MKKHNLKIVAKSPPYVPTEPLDIVYILVGGRGRSESGEEGIMFLKIT